MNKLFEALFPEGKRKLVVTLVALIIGALFEKYNKGGLTDEMVTALLGIVGIFTSGNMIEHIMAAFGKNKTEEIKDTPEQDSDYAEYRLSVPNVREPTAQEVIQSFSSQLSDLRGTITGMQKQMGIQTQNTQAIVDVINTMRGGAATTAQAARGVPANTAAQGNREL